MAVEIREFGKAHFLTAERISQCFDVAWGLDVGHKKTHQEVGFQMR
jgi:hypothetical protein